MSEPKPTVYIVEDEALIVMEIKDRLMNLGYTISGTAARGEVAVDEIAKLKPDLVLMDIRLAGKMDGIEAATALLGVDPPAVVFLTAYADDDVLRRMVDAQPYGYIVKPFSPRELHATLQAALYRSRLDRTLRSINARLDTEVRERTAQLAASEARLKEAQKIAQIGDWSAERPDGDVYWSEEIYEIFGYDRTKPAPRREDYLHEIVLPDDLETVRSMFDVGLGLGETRGLEHRFRRPDGTIGWVRLEGRAEVNAAGKPIQIRGIVQDVTERKVGELKLADLNATLERRVEERASALFETELRLRALFEQDSVGICETDTMTGRGIRVNRKFAEIVGYPVDELIGVRYMAITHPDDVPGDMEYVGRLKRGDVREYSREKRFIRKDGSTVWVNIVISPLWAPGQTPSTHISVVSDISARKRLDLTMRAISSDLMSYEGMDYVEAAGKALGNILPADIVFITRFDHAAPTQFETLVLVEDGQVLANRTYDLAGKPCEDVFRGEPQVVRSGVWKRYPADSFMAERAIEAYAAAPLVETSGRIIGHIGIMRRRPLRSEELVTTILNMFSVAVSAALVHERSRREYRDLFEFAPDGLVLSDPKGRIVLINQQAENIFGWSRAELIGQSIELLIPRELRHGHVGLREGFYQTPKRRRMAVERGSLQAVRKDGSVFPVEVDLAPVETDEGVMIAAAVRDITLRKTLEVQLAQSTKMEALGKLTGGMAHDFNNYLSVIMGNLDLLKDTVEPRSKQAKLVTAAMNGAVRGAELTQSLLAFSRQQPLDPRAIDINRRVQSISVLLKRTLGEDIRLSTALAPRLWSAKVDAARLDSCIVNLANNARDAMPRGGALLIATRNVHIDDKFADTHPGIVEGDYILIEVSDTGEGMTPEIVERVFEPFFSTKGAGHGTGLGLSMVYGFVKQSGGYVDIDTERGRGTSIRLYLPRADENAAREDVAQASEAARPSQGTAATILLVEDNDDVRRTAAAQLTALGYQVVQARNGDAARAILEENAGAIDLLFTDIVMPGELDGFALATLAVERHPGMAVLLTSGFPGDVLRRRDGGDEFPMLAKPYRNSELAKMVREALEMHPGAAAPEGEYGV